jgi:hypothetical protein
MPVDPKPRPEHGLNNLFVRALGLAIGVLVGQFAFAIWGMLHGSGYLS